MGQQLLGKLPLNRKQATNKLLSDIASTGAEALVNG